MTDSLLTRRSENAATADDAASQANDAELARVLEAYLADVEAGRAPSAAELLAAHPHLAERLEACLASLAFVEQAGGEMGAAALVDGITDPLADERATLGDFRLLREIGRGGMGIVYEAEQLSLARRVAVKVLPFAAMLDQRQLARFKNEARAAAGLHHPHIVPVYYVGAERGVHFYAMQYIEGKSLGDALNPPPSKGGARGGIPVESSTSNVNTIRADSATSLTQPLPSGERSPSANDTLHNAAAATLPDLASPAHLRRIAELGVQAAEALHHAHESGVIHRDVKPSNLLVDDAGHLWVADFGLARIGADATLTVTGDLAGTLRYMSPEQLRGKAALVDHRTDVYSLGVTLYELLTGRPAFNAESSEQLLDQILNAEPPAPRTVNRAIPADLETIVLKAIAKDAAARYATAQDLADDLRRFLDAKPIVARRPTLGQRCRRWLGRHAFAAAAAVGVLLLAVAGLAASTVMLNTAHQEAVAGKLEAEQNLQIAVDAIDRLLIQFAEDAHHHGQLHHAEIMLGDAVTAYERVLAGAEDPAILIKAAGAHSALSGVFQAAGQTDRALEQADSGLQLLGGLASDDADADDARNVRANLLIARAAALLDNEQFDAAQSSLEETVAIRERLAAAGDAAEIDNERQGDLLVSIKAQAELTMKRGDTAATELLLKRCVAIVERRPKGLQYGPWWADQRSDLYQLSGAIASERGDDAAAVEAFAAAVERQQLAVECLPDSERFQNDLYACRRDLADAFVHAGRLDEAAAEIATFVGEFSGRLQAYIDGFDLLLDCADQADADAASTYIQQAGELIQRAPERKLLPADERRALAWRLATCPHRELRDGARAEKIASHLCFQAFMDPKNLEVLAAAELEIADYKGAATSAWLAIGFARDGGSGAQLVLLALGRAREGEIDVAKEVWARAVAWREANPLLDDRGLKALVEEAEQQFAAAGSTPSTPPPAEAQR